MAKLESSFQTPIFDPNAAAKPGSGIFGLPYNCMLSHVVLIPVPFEATTSYGGGASKGPAAIFDASKQVDLYDRIAGRPYERGIHMPEAPMGIPRLNRLAKDAAQLVIAHRYDLSGTKLQKVLDTVNEAGAEVNAIVCNTTRTFIDEKKIVGIVGGDHSVSFGAIKAHAEVYGPIGVLQIDAHADLRKAYEGFTWSHASVMYNVMDLIPGVKLVQVGVRDYCEEEAALIESNPNINTFFDEKLQQAFDEGRSWGSVCKDIVGALPEKVYVSFDIDGLDPSLCPHTGTPVPGGLSFRHAVSLLKAVAARRRIVGFDLVEVAPGEGNDEWDANVGARILYKLIGCTLLSQAKAESVD